MTNAMDSEYYFYEQKRFHNFPKRLKKIPEDLPDSLKFAHLNPKVAAFLASKEKQKNEDLFDDGRKRLMPEISKVFNTVKNHLDSYDDDSQRYFFEETKRSADNVLHQLSHIIYFYDNIASHIPKSLEYQLMSGYTELTTDVQVLHREWQTHSGREAHMRRLIETQTEYGQVSESGGNNKKRLSTKTTTGLPEIVEDGRSNAELDGQNIKCNDRHMLHFSKHDKLELRKSNDSKGPGLVSGREIRLKRGLHDHDYVAAVTENGSEIRSMTNPSYYMSVIQFQLSSKACEEKGWIFQKGKEEELAKEAILEYCMQRLQQELKNIKDQKTNETQMGLNFPVVVRYYGDTRRETLLKYRKLPVKVSTKNSMKDGKPSTPKMFEDLNKGRQLMLTMYIDGTTVAYYPSGRPSVVASAAGHGQAGFYTIVYDDNSDKRILAVFTPSGRGACYHMNGNARFLSTIKGGHIANKDGKVIRQWKWLQTHLKMPTPVQFQLNQYLSFRCLAENYSVIVFTCQNETARFFVHSTSGVANQTRDENEQLLTAFNFSSNAARELLMLQAPKVKVKSKRKKDKLTKQLSELVRLVNVEDKLLYDLESDKELARLQRKARNLVDDWLEHYRITIGLKSPTLTHMSETPHKSNTGAFSAKTADRKEDRSSSLCLDKFLARTPSAPTKISVGKSRDSSTKLDLVTSNLNASPTVKFSHIKCTETPREGLIEEYIRPLSSSFRDKLSHLSESGKRSKSGITYTNTVVLRQPTSSSLPEKENIMRGLNLCPVALRKQLLSNTSFQCRCRSDVIPYIMDVEYETYINEMAPKNQLQIIAVVSSLHPETNFVESMLNQIYENQSRNRTYPCPQSRSDMFRILRYDINTAIEGSDHKQPYLMTQHNVVPGMFLIYAGGHLLFCDLIFNGYGNAKKDFKKQVMKSRLDFLRGFNLPRDFRFSSSHVLHGFCSPWGGEICSTQVKCFGGLETSLISTSKVISNHVCFSDPHAENIRNMDIAKLLNSSQSAM